MLEYSLDHVRDSLDVNATFEHIAYTRVGTHRYSRVSWLDNAKAEDASRGELEVRGDAVE
jgi:hypothetical protein